MTATHTGDLAQLYRTDETAWLERTAELLEAGAIVDVDAATLSEYLRDMARRDYRELESRLVVLVAHLLKWCYQPDRRSKSWSRTILTQQHEVESLVVSGVLANHAAKVIGSLYPKAVKFAARDTDLSPDSFPPQCPWPMSRIISGDLDDFS